MLKTLPQLRAPALPAGLNLTLPKTLQQQVAQMARNGGIRPNSSVEPGGSEMVGTIINGGGPYTGTIAEHSAYTTSDFNLSYPPGATGNQTLYAPLTLPTNGGCFASSTVAINTGHQNYSFLAVWDFCGSAHLVAAFPIDATFVNNYAYTNSDGWQVYQTLSWTPNHPVTASSKWYLLIWNPNTSTWNTVASDTGTTGQTAGFSVWETAYQPGPCSGATASVVLDNLALFNPNTAAYESVAPTMAFTTSSITGPGSLHCFNSDSTGPASNNFFLAHANNFWRVRRVSAQTPTCTTLAGVSGYYPCDLQAIYKLPSATAGAGRTVAIVDAFDDPNAEADLAVYRAKFGLAACTTANGCFKKTNQTGAASPLPVADAGWAAEISLDLDMASAICPKCHILLVEANDNSDANLFLSVDTAAGMTGTFKPSAISNSYGRGEDPGDLALNTHFNHPGIAITASSGDNAFAFGPQYPAGAPTVTAVGGTSVYPLVGSRGAFENAWNNAGAGCSTVEAKPTWQLDTGCTMRTIADVSAIADPFTGVAVYDSYPSGGWGVYGGTSVASPVIAGVYALGGSTKTKDASWAYSHAASLFDVVNGSDGTCSPVYLCGAVVGYDGPTGMGTPNGVTAFSPTVLQASSVARVDSGDGPIRDVVSHLRSGRAVRVCAAAVTRRHMRCHALRLVGF